MNICTWRLASSWRSNGRQTQEQTASYRGHRKLFEYDDQPLPWLVIPDDSPTSPRWTPSTKSHTFTWFPSKQLYAKMMKRVHRVSPFAIFKRFQIDYKTFTISISNNYKKAHFTMALVVDKHRPRSLDQLTYHDDLSDRLRSLVGSFASYISCPSYSLYILYIVYTRTWFHTYKIPSRHNPVTFLISSSTDPPAPVKRPASYAPSKNSTDPPSRKSKLIPESFSYPPRRGNSNLISYPLSII